MTMQLEVPLSTAVWLLHRVSGQQNRNGENHESSKRNNEPSRPRPGWREEGGMNRGREEERRNRDRGSTENRESRSNYNRKQVGSATADIRDPKRPRMEENRRQEGRSTQQNVSNILKSVSPAVDTSAIPTISAAPSMTMSQPSFALNPEMLFNSTNNNQAAPMLFPLQYLATAANSTEQPQVQVSIEGPGGVVTPEEEEALLK